MGSCRRKGAAVRARGGRGGGVARERAPDVHRRRAARGDELDHGRTDIGAARPDRAGGRVVGRVLLQRACSGWAGSGTVQRQSVREAGSVARSAAIQVVRRVTQGNVVPDERRGIGPVGTGVRRRDLDGAGTFVQVGHVRGAPEVSDTGDAVESGRTTDVKLVVRIDGSVEGLTGDESRRATRTAAGPTVPSPSSSVATRTTATPLLLVSKVKPEFPRYGP